MRLCLKSKIHTLPKTWGMFSSSSGSLARSGVQVEFGRGPAPEWEVAGKASA